MLYQFLEVNLTTRFLLFSQTTFKEEYFSSHLKLTRAARPQGNLYRVFFAIPICLYKFEICRRSAVLSSAVSQVNRIKPMQFEIYILVQSSIPTFYLQYLVRTSFNAVVRLFNQSFICILFCSFITELIQQWPAQQQQKFLKLN